MSELALFGGEKAVKTVNPDMEKWPIYTEEDEAAVVDVIRNRNMSGSDITKKFEKEFADWMGVKYALGYNSGTASLMAAMYGAGVRKGDEVICPTITYWASCLQVYGFGGTVVFANVDDRTLCIDPDDIERKITPRTKAIIAVHYLGHPCDMDRIMAIAKKHGIKVIEDVSHAQGGKYKGRMLGTIGDVAGISLMTGKAFAIGEAGMLVTNNREIYEHALALGTYERTEEEITCEDLKPYVGLPLCGYKFRMHQMSSAVGRVQLKYYDQRCEEIRRAMNYFWDLLEGVPGIRPHRTDESEGTTMGGFYLPHGIYVPEELGGLSVTRFCEAVRAEGAIKCLPGCNAALHTHAVFQTADVYGEGKPTRIANSDHDVRLFDKNLAAAEKIGERVFRVPWLKKFIPEQIEEYANAFKKVVANYKELLPGDQGNPEKISGWHFFQQKESK